MKILSSTLHPSCKHRLDKAYVHIQLTKPVCVVSLFSWLPFLSLTVCQSKLLTTPLHIICQALCFSLQTQSPKKINAHSRHSAMAVGIIRLSSLRVILRVHSLLLSFQTTSLGMWIISACLVATMKMPLTPLRICNHWPEKTTAVPVLFSWNCKVSGALNPQAWILELHMPNRGCGGCIWVTICAPHASTIKY